MNILEAFGHAPTLFNSNSTRFSKYIDLSFTSHGDLFTASISHFLLEKSRVTLDFPNDRNFLIFYYLLSGLDSPTLSTLGLSDIQSHRITRMSEGLSTYQSRQWNEKFYDLEQGMLSQGFTDEEVKCIYRILSVIVLLCDIEFGWLRMVKDNKATQGWPNEILYIKNHLVLQKGYKKIPLFL